MSSPENKPPGVIFGIIKFKHNVELRRYVYLGTLLTIQCGVDNCRYIYLLIIKSWKFSNKDKL